MSLLDLADRVPIASELVSGVLDRHVLGEPELIPLESPHVSPIRICEGSFHSPNHTPRFKTTKALNAPLIPHRTVSFVLTDQLPNANTGTWSDPVRF
jgi:hypothetical protein